jgi:putative ABC transport system permease protein
MNKLKQIINNLRKRSVLTALRIAGLVIGLGVSLYIFELNTYEKSYDSFWTDADHIYRVCLKLEQNDELVSHSARNFIGAPRLLQAEIPGIVASSAFQQDDITVFCNENQFNNVHCIWTDTSFFNVFQDRIILSAESNYWNDVHGVMISESFAKKLYGDKNPINQKFRLNEGWELSVKAVFKDLPENSHLNFDLVASLRTVRYYMRNFDNVNGVLIDNNPNARPRGIDPYSARSWSTPTVFRRYVYIRLDRNTNIESVKAQVTKAMEKVSLPDRYANSKIGFDFQPVESIHLHSNLEHEFQTNGSATRVRFLNLIAFIVLLVSAVNFLNLTNIQTIGNGKQYAIHKLNGAENRSILGTIFLDNLIVSVISALLAIGLLVLLKVTVLLGNDILTNNLLLVFLILLLTVIISTFIPYLSALKGRFQIYIKSQSGSLQGNWKGRKSMVIIQFVIAILLISGTILIRKQLEFMSNYRLGFDPQQTMFACTPLSMNQNPQKESRLNSFKSEVMKIPGLTNFCVSSSVPGRPIKRQYDNVRAEKQGEVLSTSFNSISISDSYTNLFDIELIAGRKFLERTSWRSDEVLINETALEELGYDNPDIAIGKFIDVGNRSLVIAGVIHDYHHLSLKSEIKPLILTQNITWDLDMGYYNISFDPMRSQEVLKAVTDVWNQIYPTDEATFHFTDKNFENQYLAEQEFKRISTMGSLLALLISCLGLFAIASFNTQKRIKEIGIRKVSGAKVFQVIKMLNADLIKWVVIAFVIATPVAYYAMYKWLENFAYKTTLSWWVFALAGVLALGIALLTVSWQSWRAATRNPVEALRYE